MHKGHADTFPSRSSPFIFKRILTEARAAGIQSIMQRKTFAAGDVEQFGAGYYVDKVVDESESCAGVVRQHLVGWHSCRMRLRPSDGIRCAMKSTEMTAQLNGRLQTEHREGWTPDRVETMDGLKWQRGFCLLGRDMRSLFYTRIVFVR